jgi:hypothetical protein
VAAVIESSGNIESVCTAHALKVGAPVTLVFRALDEAEPPFTLKITSPAGKVVLERVLRELPTGKPQSAPAITFTPGAPGEYRVDIWQLYGKNRGQALLRVADADADAG